MIEPPPRSNHHRRDLAHPEVDADLVDLDHAPVLIELTPDERRLGVDPGVVDQHVDTAMQCDRRARRQQPTPARW